MYASLFCYEQSSGAAFSRIYFVRPSPAATDSGWLLLLVAGSDEQLVMSDVRTANTKTETKDREDSIVQHQNTSQHIIIKQQQ